MSGIDGASWNNKRLRGVPDIFQASKHTVEFHADDSNNIFANDPSGPAIGNDAKHFRPERAVIARASALPADTEWLAWEPACEHIALNPGNITDVSVVSHSGPVFFEHFTRIRVNLREANCLKSFSLECQAESTNATE
jgi:hypothetical protein